MLFVILRFDWNLRMFSLLNNYCLVHDFVLAGFKSDLFYWKPDKQFCEKINYSLMKRKNTPSNEKVQEHLSISISISFNLFYLY